MNSSEEIEILVQLLEEGTEVWRPVKAESLNNDLFKIISNNELDETWEFKTGQTVKCINKTFVNGESGLIAIEKV